MLRWPCMVRRRRRRHAREGERGGRGGALTKMQQWAADGCRAGLLGPARGAQRGAAGVGWMQVARPGAAWRSPWCPAALRPAVPPCPPCPPRPAPCLPRCALRAPAPHTKDGRDPTRSGWLRAGPGRAAPPSMAASAASSVGGSFPPPGRPARSGSPPTPPPSRALRANAATTGLTPTPTCLSGPAPARLGRVLPLARTRLCSTRVGSALRGTPRPEGEHGRAGAGQEGEETLNQQQAGRHTAPRHAAPPSSPLASASSPPAWPGAARCGPVRPAEVTPRQQAPRSGGRKSVERPDATLTARRPATPPPARPLRNRAAASTPWLRWPRASHLLPRCAQCAHTASCALVHAWRLGRPRAA